MKDEFDRVSILTGRWFGHNVGPSCREGLLCLEPGKNSRFSGKTSHRIPSGKQDLLAAVLTSWPVASSSRSGQFGAYCYEKRRLGEEGSDFL